MDCRLISMETMMVAVFAKIVNTIHKETIVINVSQSFIVHTVNTGMKLMFVDVSENKRKFLN